MKRKQRLHQDNIATPGAPVWRGKVTTPLTPRAVRLQLIAEAAELPELERQRYVQRRLTPLDRALSDDQAGALNEWLLCEELLAGRAKTGSYGQTVGGRPGPPSPIPDRMMLRVRRHQKHRHLWSGQSGQALRLLAAMMASPHWDLAEGGWQLHGRWLTAHQAKRRFIRTLRDAAACMVSRRNELPDEIHTGTD